MKKIVLTAVALLFLSFGLRLSAGPVSADRALGLANQMMPAVSTRAAEPLKVLWDGEVAAGVEAPALYVIGRESGGFVIIAGDDRVYPVLAISDREVFRVEGMPANVRWWMERMKAYVRSVAVPEAGAVAAWSARTRADASLPAAEVTGKVECLTPTWDQGNNDPIYFNGANVFNAKCPMATNGERTVTGCVPLALGEILTYESGQSGITMPTSAHGTVEAYNTGSDYAPTFPYELGTTYDWAGLRTLTDISAVKAARNAGNTALLDNLAQLLADLGVIVQATYNTAPNGGTSGHVNLVKLVEHLDINKRAHLESASDYTDRQWVAMLKEEIAQRPVLYSGSTVAAVGQWSDGSPYYAGHQFIFDGYGKYADEDVFHVNFGWGGSCNGYYRHLNLETNTSTNGWDNYSRNGAAVFGFYPDAASTYLPIISYTSAQFTSNMTVKGLSVDGDLSTSLSFVIYFVVSNESSADYSGTLRFVQEDKDGTLKKVVGSKSYSLAARHYSGTGVYATCASLAFGDRLVGQYSSDEVPGGWEYVKYVDDGTLHGEIPVMPAPFIRTASSYAVGDYFTFSIKNCSSLFAGTVWTVIAPDGTKTTYPQSDREFQLTQAGKYKIDAAIAEAVGGTVTEHVVTVINVQ